MAAEIVNQPAPFSTTSDNVVRNCSSAALILKFEATLQLLSAYEEKSVEAQRRLKVVLDFEALQPKTVRFNHRQIPSPQASALMEIAGVKFATLWRWLGLYRSAWTSTAGKVYRRAQAGFEGLIERPRGRSHAQSHDGRYKISEELRRTTGGLCTRRHRPMITKVWRNAPPLSGM